MNTSTSRRKNGNYALTSLFSSVGENIGCNLGPIAVTSHNNSRSTTPSPTTRMTNAVGFADDQPTSSCWNINAASGGKRGSDTFLNLASTTGRRKHRHQHQQEQQQNKSKRKKRCHENSTVDDLEAGFSKQLTFQEQSAITEEIHGVRTADNETTKYELDGECDPTSVNQSLEDLIVELNKIPAKEKQEYKRACFLAPSLYENNRKFNLMFLRSTRFDTKKAASKIVAFFKVKCNLFGSSKVAKEITLEDLRDTYHDGSDNTIDDSLTAIKRGGSVMLLPLKDMAGRKVFLATMSEYNTTHIEEETYNKLRADWYAIMNAIQDDEIAQQRGLIFVGYHVNTTNEQFSKFLSNLTTPLVTSVYPSLPYKTVCFHYCYSNPIIRTTLSFQRMFQYYTKSEVQQRFREHYGNSHMEVQYSLMGYGVPMAALTIDFNGQIKHKFLMNYIERQCTIEKQKADEEKQQQLERIVAATDKDVLLGRGVPYQSHPGNVQLANLIKERFDEYHSIGISRIEKTNITWDIVNKVRDTFHGTFLQLERESSNNNDGSNNKGSGDDGTDNDAADSSICSNYFWKEVSDEQARDKVSYGFRSKSKMDKQRKLQEQKQQRQQLRKQAGTAAITGGDEADNESDSFFVLRQWTDDMS